jgi:hypothetical protein
MSFSQQQSLENRPKTLAGSLAVKAGIPSCGQLIRRRTDAPGLMLRFTAAIDKDDSSNRIGALAETKPGGNDGKGVV